MNGELIVGSWDALNGVVAQLVERLICIQEAWGSTPHNSIFLSSPPSIKYKDKEHSFLVFSYERVYLQLSGKTGQL